MLRIFKDSFKITSDNLILSTPPLLFTALILFYTVLAERNVKNIFSEYFVLLVILLMFSVLISGWGYMIKLAVKKQEDNKNNNKNKDAESFKLINEFSTGVGEYFIPCVFYLIGTFVIFIVVIAGVYMFCLKFIGSLGIDFITYLKGIMSFSVLKDIIAEMNKEQFIRFSNWTLVTGIFSMLFALFTMFWPIEIFYKTKNVLKALYYSIINVLTKPQIIILFLFIIASNTIFSMINILALKNIFILFIFTLIYFYFIVYVFVLLFLYYERKIKSNSDSISDSNGKE